MPDHAAGGADPLSARPKELRRQSDDDPQAEERVLVPPASLLAVAGQLAGVARGLGSDFVPLSSRELLRP